MLGAVEAGGTKFVAALAQPDGIVLARTRIATTSPEATFAALRGFFHQASAAHGAMSGFGIGSFGPIGLDPAAKDYGRLLATPKPGWAGASFVDALADFGVPLVIDSDVNAAALAEWQLGAGQACDSLAYITVGTGIGVGVLHNGRAPPGLMHLEAGHIPVQRHRADAFAGLCPFHGDCLEGLASGPAIMARWGHDLASATPAEIAIIGDYLGQLAASLVLLHMPQRIIMGGGVLAAPGLLAAVQMACAARLNGYVPMLPSRLADYIVAPGLGDAAGLAGAILLAQRAITLR